MGTKSECIGRLIRANKCIFIGLINAKSVTNMKLLKISVSL